MAFIEFRFLYVVKLKALVQMAPFQRINFQAYIKTI